MSGHVYVAQGDMRSIACDAWLLPTDKDRKVSDGWGADLQHEVAGFATPDGWGDTYRAARLRASDSPELWIADVGGVGLRPSTGTARRLVNSSTLPPRPAAY
jgi:hypothetical protein